MKSGFGAVAKAFILYRDERNRARETKSEKEKTEKEKLDFSEDIIQKFISVYDLEPKSFDFLLSIDKQFVIDELTRIKTEMSNEYKKVKTDKAK